MSIGDSICALCRASHRLLVRRLARASERPYFQLRALRAVAVEGIENQVGLAERLIIDAPAVSRMVARLEKDGLLTRREGDDRRSVRLAVTDAAAPELEAMAAGLAWLDGELRRHLSLEEQATLQRLLEKVERGMAEAP